MLGFVVYTFLGVFRTGVIAGLSDICVFVGCRGIF